MVVDLPDDEYCCPSMRMLLKTGDLSVPECEKQACFHVAFQHRRSPPVSISGTGLLIIPIPGCVPMLRSVKKVENCQECSETWGYSLG